MNNKKIKILMIKDIIDILIISNCQDGKLATTINRICFYPICRKV
jgi:hypothetical protein